MKAVAKLWAWGLLWFIWMGLSLAAFAQSSIPDYTRWSSESAYVERQILQQNVSESLRGLVADWRDQFIRASDANSGRIATLQEQILALGDLPAEGQSDPLAQRRRALNADLAKLQVPVAQAQEALSKAQGLVKEIDQLIRAEQKSALFELSKSPLSIVAWPKALLELSDIMGGLLGETFETIPLALTLLAGKQLLASFVLSLLIALLLLLAAPRIVQRLSRDLTYQRQGLVSSTGFLSTLVIAVVKASGLHFLLLTLLENGFLGFQGTLLIERALDHYWAAWIFGAFWLGQRLFVGETAVLTADGNQSDERNALLVGALAIVFIVHAVLELVAHHEASSQHVLVIWTFPLLVLTTLILMRLAQQPIENAEEAVALGASAEKTAPLYQTMMWLLRRVSRFVAIIATLAGALGYMNAANALLYPFVLTLGLLASILVLQRLVSDTYEVFLGKAGAGKDALLPILIGFSFLILALPVFALIWGARAVDLIELWSQVLSGVQIGETRLSPGEFLTFVIIFTAGYMATRFVQSALKGSVLPKTSIDPGAQTALVSGIGYIGIFLAALVAISSIGIDLSSLAIVAGALSVGIGFGLQNIVSNFVSGIILLIERPVSEGDWIEVGGKMGYVRNISVRSTRIETFDRSDIIVPNADLVAGVVTNYTRGNTLGRVIVPVGVAYGTDTKHVERLLLEIAGNHPLVMGDPAPYVVFSAFGDSSLNFEIRAILRDVNAMLRVKTDLNHEIAAVFQAEGIEMPFVQRDIWLRNPEALTDGAKSSKSG